MKIVIALVLLAIWSMFSASQFSRVLFQNRWIRLVSYRPAARMIIGPIAIIILGLLFVLGGYVALSPFYMFYEGHPYWAMVIIILEAAITPFASLGEINGYKIGGGKFPGCIIPGLFALWILGFIFLILGAIMAAPVLIFF